MFIRTLIISMLLLVQQAAYGVNVGGREISIQDWDNMSANDRRAALNIYNNLNGTSLSESQLRNEIQRQSSNVDQSQVDNAVNNANNTNTGTTNTTNVDPNSPEVRSVVDDPANADLSQIQQNGNFTQDQIDAQNRAQQEIANNRTTISNLSNEVNQANTEINNTQNNINNLNNSVDQLNNQASTLQTQLNNSGDQIANLERLANEANAGGDIAEAQRIEDELAAQRASQEAAQAQLTQVQAEQARIQRDIETANARLAEQGRERQIKQGELQAAQAKETELTNSLLSDLTESAQTNGVPENIATQLEENGVDPNALENIDPNALENISAEDRSALLNALEQETANGNITLNEDGTLNVDKEAVIASQNQSNPQGFCMEDSGVCVSNERSADYLACQLKAEGEKAACEKDVARGVTRDYISGGARCENSGSPDAKACRDAGRVYNCEFNQCLTEDQVNELGDQGAECMSKEDQAAKDACFAKVKESAVRNAATGEYCLKDSAEAKACEESGKSWNCNMDFCADDLQNQAISDAVVECQNKKNETEKQHCMNDLKENGHYLLASACEEAQSPKGLECSAGGNVWNCGANACVTPDMNGRLVEAYKRCQNKQSEAEKEACMAELNEIAAAASGGEQITEEDLKSPGSPAGVGFAVVGAIGALVGSLVGGICASAAVNLISGAMAMMNEKKTAKMADQEMERLKAEYKKIEAKTKSDVISFEIQVEAINFYIMALDSAIRIAEQYAKMYDSVGNMFGVAMAIGVVEIAIYSMMKPPYTAGIKCAGINIASGGIGMGLAKKASGIAKGMAADFKDQKAKLERIRDLFNKHFGQQGGLTQYAMNSGMNRGMMTAGRSGSVTSATGSGVKNENAEGGKETVGCADSEGKFQENCACKSNNSCLSISSPPILNDTKIGRSLNKSLDLDSTFSEANSIMSGDLSTTSLNGDSLAARFKRTQKVNKKLVNQINKKYKNQLKKANVEIKYPDDKMLAAYINKVMPPSKRVGGAEKFMGNFLGDVNPKDIEDTQKQLSSNFTQDGRAVATQTKPVINTKFGKFEMPKMDEYSGEELDILAKQKDQGIVNSEFNGDMEKLKDLPDVHENSTKSLWNILTKRYHVITRQKRIGKFRTKSTR